MVARPPLRLAIAAMRMEDIPEVHLIERASFPVPWPTYAFRRRAALSWSMHRRVVVRTRNPSGEVTSPAVWRRTKASCTASSASVTLPSSR